MSQNNSNKNLLSQCIQMVQNMLSSFQSSYRFIRKYYFIIKFFNYIIILLKYILIIFILIVILLFITKKYLSYIKQNINNKSLKSNKLKFLTYNIQRLPYFFRDKINISKIINNYDIICLQEDFLPKINKDDLKDYNICHIGSNCFYKLIDSGLTIYSRIPLQFIEFVPFNNLKSVDILSDKGFLVVKYNDLFIINTHLQAPYTYKDLEDNIAIKQINQIFDYLKINNISKFIIIGDFNTELDKFICEEFSVLIPNKPTHYTEMKSVFNKTSATYKDGYCPLKIDGAIFNNIKINSHKLVKHDKLTDHMGVSFYVEL